MARGTNKKATSATGGASKEVETNLKVVLFDDEKIKEPTIKTLENIGDYRS